jgi:hypothetical protein
MTSNRDNFVKAFSPRRREEREAVEMRPSLRLSTFDRSTFSRPNRAGFTFLEVLFAVIIVGIGFIMIAAIFPVAISQTQANVSEATGIAVGRDAIRYLQGQLALPIPPGSATVPLPYTTEQSGTNNFPVIVPLAAISGLNLNQVLTADRRFAWTALYRRDLQTIKNPNPPPLTLSFPAAYAQLFAIVSQNTAEGQVTYGSAPALSNNDTGTPLASNFFNAAISGVPTINPTAFTITINNYAALNAGALGSLAVKYASGTPYDGSGSVTEGAFALVVDASVSGLNTNQANQMVGWYGQLGVVVPGAVNAAGTANTVWYLQTPPPFFNFPGSVFVFILGKPVNPLGQLTTGTASSYPNYDGPAQDVTCTSGFARINN